MGRKQIILIKPLTFAGGLSSMEKKLGKLLLAVAVAGIVVVGCNKAEKKEEAPAPAPAVTEEKAPEVAGTPAPEVKEEAAPAHIAEPVAAPAAKH